MTETIICLWQLYSSITVILYNIKSKKNPVKYKYVIRVSVVIKCQFN